MPDDSNRRRLYNNLVNAGYDLPDYGQFSQDMMDGNNMRRLHTKLRDAGYELPDYSQFRADMGYSMDAEEVSGNGLGNTAEQDNTGTGGNKATGSGGGAMRKFINKAVELGMAVPTDKARSTSTTATSGGEQNASAAQMPVLNNDTARRIDWRNSVISNEQAPEQKDEQPLGPERFAKKMEMDSALNQRNEDFHARMENIRKGNNNFGGNREQRFNPDTGRIEQVYITQSGDETNTPMEQREMNARFRGSTDLGFEERLNSAMYNVDPDNIAEQVWADAESRLAEKQTADLANIARNNMGVTPTGAGTVAFTTAKNHMTYYDIKKLSDEAWNRLGEEQKQALVNDMYGALMARYPGLDEERAWSMANDLARQQSDKRMFELAVTKNAPKDATDYFFKRVIGANSLTKLIDITARAAAGTRGDMDARDAALERYGEGHKFVGFLGSAFGMALDPFTYAAGGVGGGLSKGVTWLGGRLIGRSGMSRLGGRLLTGAAGGGGNFATFEAGQEAIEQLRYGGKVEGVDEAGRYIVGDYDPKAIGTAAARGYLIGSATGVVSPLTGNVSDQLVRATGNTATKAGIRAGQVVTSKMAEGTIFSVPEWIETYNNYATLIAAVSDPNSVDYIADEQERAQRITQLQAERGEAMMDVWTDNEAMMLAFGIQGATKSIPRRLEELRRNPQSRAGFETRLRTLLDGRDDLALTQDEQNELSRAGYGDLRDLVKDYKQNAQSDGEVPYTRIEVLMSDANVSEAARAKMYYYVTGRMLPMSTVIGSNLIETKDAQGNVTGYTVQSIGARGVVTSREFDNKRRADVELERINRQAELNSIDMGEQFVDYRGEVRRMYEACEQTADEVGAGVRNLYELMKRDPAELNDIEQRWVERVRNNYESLGDRYSASALRREISDQYGVDIDAAIAKEPNRRSDTEQQAIQAYGERLFEDVRTDKQQNGDATDIVVLLEGRADTPYERGYHADEGEGQEIAVEYATGIGGKTQEERQAAWDGVLQQIEDRANTMAAEERERARQYAYDDGSERKATLKEKGKDGQDKVVYIVSGTVTMDAYGTAVDAEKSDNTIVVFDPELGERRMISPSSDMGIASLDEVRTAEEVEAEIERRRQEYIQREKDLLTNRVQPGSDIPVEGGRATVLAMDDETATLLMPDGSQADMAVEEAQRLKDDERLAEYIATHPDARAANEQGAAAAGTGDGTAAAGSRPAEVEGVPTDYSEGMMVTLRDGRTMEVTAVGRMSNEEDGIYFVPEANGQIVELFDPQTGDNEHLDRKQLNNQVVSYQASPEATAAAVEDETTAAPAETPATPEQPIAPEAPATGATPEQSITPEAPTASSMPMRKVAVKVDTGKRDKKGRAIKKTEYVDEPDFLATTPEEGRHYIYEESGYPADVVAQLVNSKQEEAMNKLTDLRKKEPKFGDKVVGTSMSVYNQKHREWEQQVASWQQALGYWSDVKQLQQRIDDERTAAEREERRRKNEEARKVMEAERRAKEAEEAERRAAEEAKRQQLEAELMAMPEDMGERVALGDRVELPARLQQMVRDANGNRATLLRQAIDELGDDAGALDILTDEHPRTLEEVASMLLRSGKKQVRLLFNDEGVKKGIGSMMGFSRKDMNRFPYLFATSANGGVSLDRFGEMIIDAARNENVMVDENDANAGMDAAINLLSSVGSQGDINDYILSNRIADAREYRANAIRQMEMRYEEEIRQRYDMTVAERDAWVAYMDERAAAVAEMNEEEFTNIILGNNGQRTETDTEQLQAEQSGESGTDEGGGNAGNEEGAGIRSEADETAGAPDDAGRDRQGPGRAEGTEQPASPVAEAIAQQEVNENPTEGQKEALSRPTVEQREIGGAMVDQLERMGMEVSTDIAENRRVRKQAEQDNSEEGKLRNYRTPDGKIYGFSYRGKIYLDPRYIDSELPIHEYAHPWCEAFRRLNPEGWQEVVSVMQSDAETWSLVQSMNPDLSSADDIAEEMIALGSGKKGKERAEAEYRRMNAGGNFGNIWNNIVKAIQDFWKKIGDFLGIKYETPEQVYDQVVKDFANKVNPRKRVEEYLQERDGEYMQAVERGDEARAKELFDEALRENIGNGITPYVSVGSYRGNMDRLARGVKSRDPKVIAEVADLMAPIIPKDAVLVPAPSHSGEATDMLDVANAIAERTGVPVANVLRGAERGSQREAKRQGAPIASSDMGITMEGELPEGKIPVLIDNVVNSGNTAEACVRALGKGVVASLADAADRYRHVASLKSANAVVRDKNGNVVPLSKRFELGGSGYLAKQKGDDVAVGTQIPTEAEKALRDKLIEVMRGEGGMEVITDEEGQRVLDEYRDRAKLLKTFHGSGADFDVFDHSHMSEGEGNQAYGYGTYVTEVEGIGKLYAGNADGYVVYNGRKWSYYDGINESRALDFAVKATIAARGNKEKAVAIIEKNKASSMYPQFNQALDEAKGLVNNGALEYVETHTPVLYTVDIPDDNGSNYLDWVRTIPKSDRRRIADAVRRLEGAPAQSVKYVNYTVGWNQLADMIERNAWAYQEVRYLLMQAFGGRTADEKRVSDLMHDAGFVGVKYPAEYMSGGRSDGAKNYVIFDEGDLKITDKIRFHKAENGGDEADILFQCGACRGGDKAGEGDAGAVVEDGGEGWRTESRRGQVAWAERVADGKRKAESGKRKTCDADEAGGAGLHQSQQDRGGGGELSRRSVG